MPLLDTGSPKFIASCPPNRCTDITAKIEVTNNRITKAEDTGFKAAICAVH